MKHIRTITFLAVALFLLSGCASRVGTLVTSAPETKVHLSGKKLEKKLKITNTRTSRVNDLLRVQIDAYNENKKQIDLEYRFRWLDESGMEVENNTILWKPKKAEATDNVYFVAVAPLSSAVDYEFYVRVK